MQWCFHKEIEFLVSSRMFFLVLCYFLFQVITIHRRINLVQLLLQDFIIVNNVSWLDFRLWQLSLLQNGFIYWHPHQMKALQSGWILQSDGCTQKTAHVKFASLPAEHCGVLGYSGKKVHILIWPLASVPVCPRMPRASYVNGLLSKIWFVWVNRRVITLLEQMWNLWDALRLHLPINFATLGQSISSLHIIWVFQSSTTLCNVTSICALIIPLPLCPRLLLCVTVLPLWQSPFCLSFRQASALSMADLTCRQIALIS